MSSKEIEAMKTHAPDLHGSGKPRLHKMCSLGIGRD